MKYLENYSKSSISFLTHVQKKSRLVKQRRPLEPFVALNSCLVTLDKLLLWFRPIRSRQQIHIIRLSWWWFRSKDDDLEAMMTQTENSDYGSVAPFKYHIWKEWTFEVIMNIICIADINPSNRRTEDRRYGKQAGAELDKALCILWGCLLYTSDAADE